MKRLSRITVWVGHTISRREWFHLRRSVRRNIRRLYNNAVDYKFWARKHGIE